VESLRRAGARVPHLATGPGRAGWDARQVAPSAVAVRIPSRGEKILAAAGLITGGALLELIIGIAMLGGFDDEVLHLVKGLPG